MSETTRKLNRSLLGPGKGVQTGFGEPAAGGAMLFSRSLLCANAGKLWGKKQPCANASSAHNGASADTARSCLRARLQPNPLLCFPPDPHCCQPQGVSPTGCSSIMAVLPGAQNSLGAFCSMFHCRGVLACPSSSLSSGFQGTQQAWEILRLSQLS